VLNSFPFKPNVDQTWTDDCGDAYNWVESSPAEGNVFIRFREGRVVQLESTSRRFHTVDDIRTYDPPEAVQSHYKGLRAYVLVGLSSSAFGGRPLIFWTDQARGIAFSFAYYPEEHRRYLYKIIVFKPNSALCPEGMPADPLRWKELPPYSLEPPDQKAELLFDFREYPVQRRWNLSRR
jgi:hypothetical protein